PVPRDRPPARARRHDSLHLAQDGRNFSTGRPDYRAPRWPAGTNFGPGQDYFARSDSSDGWPGTGADAFRRAAAARRRRTLRGEPVALLAGTRPRLAAAKRGFSVATRGSAGDRGLDGGGSHGIVGMPVRRERYSADGTNRARWPTRPV